MNGRPLQTKLAISEQGDAYEQEADRVAERVMHTGGTELTHIATRAALPHIQRQSESSTQTEESWGQVYQGRERNDLDDFVVAGISKMTGGVTSSEVKLVAPKGKFSPPVGWDLDCFIRRDGTAKKFHGKLAKLPLIGTSELTASEVKTKFPQYEAQAVKLFAANPKPQTRQKPLQRKATGNFPSSATSSTIHEALSSSGQPLDPYTRAFMELGFGHDFSHVRVHTDAKAAESARAVNGLAYTVGSNIIFASDQYIPTTSTGRHLLAHELTHVVQQQGAEPTLQRQPEKPGTSAKPTETTVRKDVVLLMAAGLEAEAATLAPNATPIKVTSLRDMVTALRSVKQPINRLIIIAHSLSSGDLGFETANSITFVYPAKIATALSGTVSAANAPEVVDFRGCSLGSNPSGMDEIRAAVGAKSAIGGNCFMIVQDGGPIMIGGKKIVRPFQVTKANRAAFEEGLSTLVDGFGKAKGCVLDNSEQAYFRAGGKLVAAWMSPNFDTKWNERKSRCYKSLTPEVVDPASKEDFSPGLAGQCRLIKVNQPAGE